MENSFHIFRQLFLFGIVGTVGFIIDAGILYLTQKFVGLYVGRLISFIIAVFSTWLLNRNLTFKKSANKTIVNEFLYYLGCMIFGGLANLLTYYILISHYDFIVEYPVIGVAIGSIVGMSINFVTSKWLVFKS